MGSRQQENEWFLVQDGGLDLFLPGSWKSQESHIEPSITQLNNLLRRQDVPQFKFYMGAEFAKSHYERWDQQRGGGRNKPDSQNPDLTASCPPNTAKSPLGLRQHLSGFRKKDLPCRCEPGL